MQIDFRRRGERRVVIRFFAFFHGTNRFFQHIGVHLESDFDHFTGLFFSQHFASTTDFEIVHGEEEPASQFFHLANSFKSSLCLFGQGLRIVDEQVGISLMVRTADTSTQLVQLGKPELVGAMHDHRIGVRDVNAGFDNRRAQQDVIAVRNEVTHDFFKFAFMHLAVSDADTRFRQEVFQHDAPVFDRFDFVVQKVNLTATLEFAHTGFPDDGVVFGTHESFNCQPFLRGGRNDRKAAQAIQRHAERSRDRGCRQGQDIHFGANGF